jgi:hypothetical protein
MENKLTAQQLRIGNLIQKDYEGVMEVVNINSERLEYIDAKKPNYRAIGRFELAFVEPIPLTEEWLLKFGFEKKENKQYWFKDDSMLRFALLDGCLHCSIGDDENGILYNKLYSVHQFQNLFYAVNNTELTIK